MGGHTGILLVWAHYYYVELLKTLALVNIGKGFNSLLKKDKNQKNH